MSDEICCPECGSECVSTRVRNFTATDLRQYFSCPACGHAECVNWNFDIPTAVADD